MPDENQSASMYDTQYGGDESEAHRAVRAEAFGEDLGQTSWITAEECDQLGAMVAPRRGGRLLEVACGAGGAGIRLAQGFDLSVVGVDVNAAGVRAATRRAAAAGMGERARFLEVDANAALPFAEESFDCVFCNDAINHLADRAAVLRDWRRVLKAGGRCLFTDPVVVTGLVSNEELAARSSIGFFLFSTAEANRAALERAGFRVEQVVDLTEGVARTSARWREARARHREAVVKVEGAEAFEDLQRFLGVVHRLSSEGRLSRMGFVGVAV